MKTKRFVSVLMIFVLLLSLVACEKKNSPTPSATTDLTPTAKATETPVPSPSATPTAQVTPTEKPTLTPTAELTPTEEPVSGTPTPTEEPTETPTPTVTPTPLPGQLSAPVIRTTDTGLTWTADKNAVKIVLKVNNGNYADATTYSFATAAGTYTVSVKAIGDGTKYTDSTESAFTYTVKETSLSVVKTSGNAASVSFKGKEAGYFDGDKYVKLTQNTFTATKTGDVRFKVLNGWNENEKTFYIGEKEETVYLVATAQSAMIIENATDKVSADLQDEWEVKKWGDSNWIDCGASISVTKSRYDGLDAYFNLDCWANGTVFRYKKEYSTKQGFDTIEFDAKGVSVGGENVQNFKVQLMDKEGIYVTYDLGKISGNWAHYVISMSDPGWKINGTSESLQTILAQMKMVEYYEVIPYCCYLNFVTTGSTQNGQTAHIAMDNLKFTYTSGTSTSVTEFTPSLPEGMYLVDFEDGNVGDKYQSEMWNVQEYQTDGWKDMSYNVMNCREKDGSKVVNVASEYSMQRMAKYRRRDNAAIGTFNTVSIDLGNYFDNAVTLKIKFGYLDKNGDYHYLIGDPSTGAAEDFAPTTGMVTKSFKLDKKTEIYGLFISVQNSANSNAAYLYFDNIILN